eukprot:gene9031-16674_t
MAIGSNINAMTFIQKNAPIIFNILATIQSSPLPNVWKELFLLLGRISKQSCDKKPHTLPEATVAQKKNTLAYFPNWPVQCSRGSYYQDKSKKNEGPHCKKDKKKTTLLPGLFTIYCEHGICYGFEIMDTHESPNVPFTIFRMRFPTAPKAILYDNSCHLHLYCINRDPGFFGKCTFAVDRFHWKNHKGLQETVKLLP